MKFGCVLRAALIVAATLLGVGNSRAADVTVRFSTAAPPADFLAKALEVFKAEVEAANVGVKVETHPASALFRQGTEVPALQRGNLEMSTMTTFEVGQQMAEYGLFNRAYLFRDYDHLRMVFDGPIGQGYRRAVADKMASRFSRLPISAPARSICARSAASRRRATSRA
jgi:TRAP-type transport system periplasmic protein